MTLLRLSLAAATFALCASHAQAVQPSALVSASICNPSSATQGKPHRNGGVTNYSATAVNVSCPLNRPPNSAPVYGVMVYHRMPAGESMSCVMTSFMKQDGAILAYKFFTLVNVVSGMKSQWVYLEPYERHADAVQEVVCSLPPNGKGTLHAFETYAG